MEKKWWKEGVVYQIYPRSFHDSNGDGIGDLRGIIEKLDYIASLGIDIIWLNPVYSSPNYDNGYDISDYRNIMEDFGSLEDFQELMKGLHQRGIKLIMDLVVNHSSHEHAWFVESRKSKNNPFRDYYIWRDPAADGGPPNDWVGYFQDPAWQWDEATGQYYLHLFCPEQPDLNWENPSLRQEVYDLMNYWLDMGIDGFRMDVISLISKDYRFIDGGQKSSYFGQGFANGPRIHEYLKEMHQKTLAGRDVMTVGEATQITVDHAPYYVNADRKELDMLIHFDITSLDCGDSKWDRIPFHMDQYRQALMTWHNQLKQKGWNAFYLMNHDQPRTVSRYGNDKAYRKESAKMLLTHQLTLPATPYLYQGEEIGMTNAAFTSIDQYKDVESLNFIRESRARGWKDANILKALSQCSRDHSRTPMQWNAEDQAGFSSGTPWIEVNPAYRDINVDESENDSNSILHYFRRLTVFRKEHPGLVYGDLEFLDQGSASTLVYRRAFEGRNYLVLTNWSDNSTNAEQWIQGEVQFLMGNYPAPQSITEPLKAWEVRILL